MADNTNNKVAPEDEQVSFSVMPRGDNGELVSHPANPGAPKPVPMSDVVQPAIEHPGIWRNKYTYIALGALVLAALGGLAYFLLGSGGSPKSNAPATRLSTMFLQQYFGSATCSDQGRCGDTADPDGDGLENWDELKEQTDPTKNDTDGDGLADGDEVFIYLTDPINQYTDSRKVAKDNGYTDGSQIKNDYDPLTPGLKMTETRKQQISLETGKFMLHEPTLTTLATPAATAPTNINVFINTGKFDAAEVRIKAGDSITWINRDTASHQVASDPHPGHSELPDLESGTLATNQTYTFKFTQPGTYGYHDHLNPAIKGTVIVE